MKKTGCNPHGFAMRIFIFRRKALIILILGGAKSGKSRVAIELAKKLGHKRAFLATALPCDEEMREKIEKHKSQRDSSWTTYEEPLEVSSILLALREKYDVIVIDCLTLWLNNLLLEGKNFGRYCEDLIEKLIETGKNCHVVIVSNEVGLGIVPETPLGRKFRDYAGYLNQKVAQISDKVYFVISGIPMKIKGESL